MPCLLAASLRIRKGKVLVMRTCKRKAVVRAAVRVPILHHTALAHQQAVQLLHVQLPRPQRLELVALLCCSESQRQMPS
jgi:hypothetical protein